MKKAVYGIFILAMALQQDYCFSGRDKGEAAIAVTTESSFRAVVQDRDGDDGRAEATASTYYVDADSGSDGSDGLSPESAWRTLGRVSEAFFQPGDTVFLKRGAVWRESLVLIKSSGSAGSPITLGAYGSGPMPEINGARILRGWTRFEGPLFKKNLNSEPGIVVEDEKRLKRLEWEARAGDPHAGDVFREAEPGTWSYDPASRTLYVRCTDSADPDTHVMEAAAVVRDGLHEYGLRIRDVSYVTVQDIAVINTTHTAILVMPSRGHDTNHIVLKRLFVRNAGFTGIEVNNSPNSMNRDHEIRGLVIKENQVSDTNYHGIILAYGVAGGRILHNTVTRAGHLRLGSHGISTWSNNPGAYVHDCIIEGNSVQYTKTDRQSAEGTGIHADNHTRNNLYRNNVCRFNEGSGFLSGIKTSGCKFHYNIGYRNGKGGADFYRGGITLAEPRDVQLFNNVFYDNYPCGICWFGDGTDGVTLKNNILCNNAEYEIKIGVKAGANVVSDYNCVFHREGGRFMKWVGTDCTWKEWKRISGGDAHSINADPRFADAEERNFSLQAGSPCIDAGTYVGLSRDFDGNDVPRGERVDIGALEFFEAASPALCLAVEPAPGRALTNQKAAAGEDFLK